MIDIYMWIGQYWEALVQHREPEDCVENDDGTRYMLIPIKSYVCCQREIWFNGTCAFAIGIIFM